MTRFTIALLLCLSGCATAEQRQQYERDLSDYNKGASDWSQTWRVATGGTDSGGSKPNPFMKPSNPW